MIASSSMPLFAQMLRRNIRCAAALVGIKIERFGELRRGALILAREKKNRPVMQL